jgi:carbon monoxide dehydrogenase subunit G
MEFTDRFAIAAEPARVWTAMFDPEVMRQVLPGCRSLEQAGEGRFDVTLAAGVGVLRGVFRGSVAFEDLVPPERCRMRISAGGSLGRVSGDGSIDLAADGGGTTLEYAAAFTFAGPMAGLGEPLMRSVAGALTREAIERFRRILAAGAPSS